MTDPTQSQTSLNDCGCCEGLVVETPLEIANRPGLSAIAYRVGTQTRFKASMIAGLSASGLAELRKLRTRDDDDFTIALLDAWAMVCDVLAFYQERIANESYLLTATERASIINLARLIGYELRPGVAASTYLAFTLETGAGSPAAVTMVKGVKVQSIPGPGEKPQSFETVEEIDAMGEWNAIQPRLTTLVMPVFGSTKTYLEGVATNLKPGDRLLFVGQERGDEKTGERWDLSTISAVEPDVDNERTLVRWLEPLGSLDPHVDPAENKLKVYAMRLRASLFGYNAPAWNTLPVALRIGEIAPAGSPKPGFVEGAYAKSEAKWADARFPAATTIINLDSVYNQVVVNSWIALIKPDSISDDGKTTFPAYSELYRVNRVGEETKANFNISAKTTRLEISGENIEKFAPRDTTVVAQSEELPIAETPIPQPVWKDEIILSQTITQLAEGRKIVVSGQRPRARVEKAAGNLNFIADDGPDFDQPLETGDELIVLAPWVDSDSEPKTRRWFLLHESGLSGYVDAPEDKLTQIAADENDPVVSEVATIKSTEREDDTHSKLILSASLVNVYDRPTVTINANVGLSTHGETIAGEVLGSGNAGQTYQRFTLRDNPLTYTSAETPSGSETTLEVRVNDLKWLEVPTLFGHGPRERIYLTHTGDDRKTTVQFGDGVTGARLPMGRENVKATYRKGIGLEGLVNAKQLSLLMTRPLGVKSVINPLAATGAQDPQSLTDARTNSPITVLTLDRIVSLVDYEDFARSFSGLAKAAATWTWNLHARGVFITVAGIDGAGVDVRLHDTLVSAMLKVADPFVPITVKSYLPVTFKLVASVKIDPDYLEEKVLTAVEDALRTGFAFAARTFGQPVTLSEVISAMQNIAGVVAVDVNKLFRSDQSEAWNELLSAQAPRAGDDSSVPAAELLTLDPGPLELEVML
ncbi:MAG TPA: putative baseplate assembly protein [Pyrinomonadaceae bacterium]|nr:putative baseplate assembly protein [Pyrinomonadaceae bacterium]